MRFHDGAQPPDVGNSPTEVAVDLVQPATTVAPAPRSPGRKVRRSMREIMWNRFDAGSVASWSIGTCAPLLRAHPRSARSRGRSGGCRGCGPSADPSRRPIRRCCPLRHVRLGGGIGAHEHHVAHGGFTSLGIVSSISRTAEGGIDIVASRLRHAQRGASKNRRRVRAGGPREVACPGQEVHPLVPPELTSSPPPLIRSNPSSAAILMPGALG